MLLAESPEERFVCHVVSQTLPALSSDLIESYLNPWTQDLTKQARERPRIVSKLDLDGAIDCVRDAVDSVVFSVESATNSGMNARPVACG